MRLDKRLLFKILDDVLSIPTAPFKEFWLIDHILKRFQDRRGYKVVTDKCSNILIRYAPPNSKKINLTLHAHLDHPGFIFKKTTARNKGIAEALGGVAENCKGSKIRFYSDPDDPGRLAKVTRYLKRREHQEIYLSLKDKIAPGSIGMWDFPHLKRVGSWLYGRAFDDNLGIAILIYLLESISNLKVKYSFSVLFTRAEEVGYVGALELLKRRKFKLSKNILTIEMPRAGMGLVPGDGVMLRAGDRYLNFNSDFLLYLEEIAAKCLKNDKNFRSQRRLGLFGGTEVTSFDLFGHTAGALCLAVENGHNINRKNNGKPAPERVHIRDLLSLVKMLHLILNNPYRPDLLRKKLKRKVELKYKALKKRLYDF